MVSPAEVPNLGRLIFQNLVTPVNPESSCALIFYFWGWACLSAAVYFSLVLYLGGSMIMKFLESFHFLSSVLQFLMVVCCHIVTPYLVQVPLMLQNWAPS